MNQVAEDYLNNTLENVEVHLVSIITYNENKKLKFDTETGIRNQIETIIAERYHLFDNNKIDVENNPILRRITYIVFPVWDLKGLVEEFLISGLKLIWLILLKKWDCQTKVVTQI